MAQHIVRYLQQLTNPNLIIKYQTVLSFNWPNFPIIFWRCVSMLVKNFGHFNLKIFDLVYDYDVLLSELWFEYCYDYVDEPLIK